MKLRYLILFSTIINVIRCEIILMGIAAAVASYFGYQKYYECEKIECCTEQWINKDISRLDRSLKYHVYGQPIVYEIIVNSVKGFWGKAYNRKALTLSFHGTPGIGKNFVAQMIGESVFRLGTKSKNYHFFNGRSYFSHTNSFLDKQNLYLTILKALKDCPRSVFVFDEIDKMPETILDALVPFIDYHSQYHSDESIFIFLSNTGGEEIMSHYTTLWEEGKKREDLKLLDFEQLIAVGAFNEKGGYRNSDIIKRNLIDHYIPFLPLEIDHVEKCIKKEFEDLSHRPTPEEVQEVLSHLTFGPSPYNLYATTGCKRVYPKVSSIVNRKWMQKLNT